MADIHTHTHTLHPNVISWISCSVSVFPKCLLHVISSKMNWNAPESSYGISWWRSLLGHQKAARCSLRFFSWTLPLALDWPLTLSPPGDASLSAVPWLTDRDKMEQTKHITKLATRFSVPEWKQSFYCGFVMSHTLFWCGSLISGLRIYNIPMGICTFLGWS